MDRETVRYIIDNFGDLLPLTERLALRRPYTPAGGSFLRDYQLNNLTIMYRDKGLLPAGMEVLDLIKLGPERMELLLAERLLLDFNSQVFMNKCPRCGKLARTAYAKQCRHCNHSWRDS